MVSVCLRSLTVCRGNQVTPTVFTSPENFSNIVISTLWTFGRSPSHGLGGFSCYLYDLRVASRPLAQTLPGRLSSLAWKRGWAESSLLHCMQSLEVQEVNLHSHSPTLFTLCLSTPVCPVPNQLLQQEGINKAKEHFHSIWNMTNDHQSANAASLFTPNSYCWVVSENLQLMKSLAAQDSS